MDEDRIEKTPGFDALRRDIDRLLQAIAAFAAEQACVPLPEAREGE
jgi:hypothetical protein